MHHANKDEQKKRMIDLLTFKKNRMFAKHGHHCELLEKEDLEALHSLTLWKRFKLYLLQIRIASELNVNSKRYLRSQGSITKEKERQIRLHPNIIHPFSDVRNWWERFLLFIYMIQFVLIPFDVAYSLYDPVEVTNAFFWNLGWLLVDMVLIGDMLLNFATGYYDHENKRVELKLSKIAKNYLKTKFLFHFLSAVPTHYDLFVEVPILLKASLELFQLVKLLRAMLGIRGYWQQFAENYELSFLQTIGPFNLFVVFTYVHFVTCMVMFLRALKRLKTLLGDMPTQHVLPHSYSTSLYISVQVITGSGFGRKGPRLVLGHIIYVFLYLASKIFVAYVLARIIEMMKSHTSARRKYVSMQRQLREYMRHKQLPENTQRRLLAYYEFRFQKSYFRESEIMNTISGQLRQEIVMHSCRKLVENVEFFKNLPLSLLVRIVSSLHSEIYLVNDVIVRANTSGDSMYFIASGTVAVLTPSGREVCHLEDGAHFGEVSIVMKEEMRVASVVAVEVCEVYKLYRKDFIVAINPYPDLLDKIERIAADRMERMQILDEEHRRTMRTLY